jgi:sialate O-acetylesterase
MKPRHITFASLFAALLLTPALLFAELKMPSIFKDDMIIQRDKAVPVWGWADAGATVTVEFAGQKKTAKADKDGKWTLTLKAMKASTEPQVMTITSSIGNQKSEIKNILIGDVWVCSGQSNMGMTVNGCQNAKEEIEKSFNPLIRQFGVDHRPSLNPEADVQGKWEIANTNTTAGFTAVGYFFAREIQKKLKIPVGFINTSWGGTPAEAWTSKEALFACADLKEPMEKQIEDFATYSNRLQKFQADHVAWEEKYGRKDTGTPGQTSPMANVSTDTADWKKMPVPGAIAKAGYGNGGIVWIRKNVEIPANWKNRRVTVEFPRITDFVTAYFNGAKIGEVTAGKELGRNPFFFLVPNKLVQPGKATIAVRVVAYNGNGGIHGDPKMIRLALSQNEGLPLDGEWLCKAETEFQPMPRDAAQRPAAPQKRDLPHTATGLFNGMVNPLIPYAFTGALWYQGESNAGRAYQYRTLFKVMINDWRDRWNNGKFPFYFCQLANFKAMTQNPEESDWAELREAQTMALELPNTGQANLIDIGEETDIHPRNKQEVGRRLALIALANTHGDRKLEYYGPVYESMKIKDGKAVIKFSHANGLVAKELPATYKPKSSADEEKPLVKPSPNSQLQGFAICGEAPAGTSNNWVWADAKIDGSTVVVWSDKVQKPVAVRYAWANNPVCNLYNKAGLPAYPFRTDDFPYTTLDKK